MPLWGAQPYPWSHNSFLPSPPLPVELEERFWLWLCQQLEEALLVGEGIQDCLLCLCHFPEQQQKIEAWKVALVCHGYHS